MVAPPPYQIPVFQQQAADPLGAYGPSFQLQDVYGTGALPYLDWVQMVQTGERTITPGDPLDQEYINRYNMEAQQTGALSFGDMMKAVVPYAAGVGYDVFTDPYLEGSFGDKALWTGASLLPKKIPFTDIQIRDPLPRNLVDDSIARGRRLQQPNTVTGRSQIPGGKVYIPELSNAETAAATGNTRMFNLLNRPRASAASATVGGTSPRIGELVGLGTDDTSYVYDYGDVRDAQFRVGGNLVADPIGSFPTPSTALSGLTDYLSDSGTYMRAGVTGLAGFGADLLTGADPVDAARTAVGSTVGGMVGGFFGPIGSMVGGAFGGALARKRVICNELVRQGLMSREHIMLDYKFTKEHLTPQHVRGYHFWAVPVVRKMREGKSVGFWRHIATHRANEIAHIYGKRDKPDYLGKVYRRIFEPACWVVGAICKQKDWQSLYSTKGI